MGKVTGQRLQSSGGSKSTERSKGGGLGCWNQEHTTAERNTRNAYPLAHFYIRNSSWQLCASWPLVQLGNRCGAGCPWQQLSAPVREAEKNQSSWGRQEKNFYLHLTGIWSWRWREIFLPSVGLKWQDKEQSVVFRLLVPFSSIDIAFVSLPLVYLLQACFLPDRWGCFPGKL